MADLFADNAIFADNVIVQRAPEALFRWLLDGVLVLAPGMHEPVRITSPGEVLWSMLAEPCTIGALIETWSALHGTEAQIARADIEPLLRVWNDGAALIVAERSG